MEAVQALSSAFNRALKQCLDLGDELFANASLEKSDDIRYGKAVRFYQRYRFRFRKALLFSDFAVLIISTINRHCEPPARRRAPSRAAYAARWIASSQGLLAMTVENPRG
jgi:hypothetical protein